MACWGDQKLKETRPLPDRQVSTMLKKFAIVFCLVALSVPVAASAQSTLSVGQRVKTTANVNVRSKPTNAKKSVLCIQTTGSVGTIVGGPTVATD
jgi:uncharacterized protein YgiM (DUF1202 family)